MQSTIQRTTQANKWIGSRLKRKEDLRLIAGRGQFVDDVRSPHALSMAILRSPHAHAKILGIDTSKALSRSGVHAVITGAQVASRFKPLRPRVPSVPANDFSIAVDKVTYVGEPVVLVVAKDKYSAEDALEDIEVSYELLKPFLDVERHNESMPIHEGMKSNVAWQDTFSFGDVSAPLDKGDFVIREKFHFHRFTSAPLEPFATFADMDKATGVLTIQSQSQVPGRDIPMISYVLGIPSNMIRFVTRDIGGGFGIKVSAFPYILLTAIASITTGRPVKWFEDRTEHLMASAHGNERIWDASATFSENGMLKSLIFKGVDVQGSYLRSPEPIGCVIWNQVSCNVYKVKNVLVDISAILTNRCPVSANRGYGRMQYLFAVERLMDIAARKLHQSSIEIRKLNYIGPDDFPYTTPSGCVYDSGQYEKTLNKALEISEHQKWREIQIKSRGSRMIGIGIAHVIESGGANYAQLRLLNPEAKVSGCPEGATINIDPSGKIFVMLSSAPQGQGHETVTAQIVADELGVEPADVTVLPGFDSFTHPYSALSGTSASRFAGVGTGAVVVACRRLRSKIVAIGAHLMGAKMEDCQFSNGSVRLAGNPEKSLSMREIAAVAGTDPYALPQGFDPGLSISAMYDFPYGTLPDRNKRMNNTSTYANNVHVAVIEIDKETGKVKLLKYVVADDCGIALNPMIVEGQDHGAAAHGIAAALYENLAYDGDGQLLSSTFMDYLAPSAVELVDIPVGHVVTPSPFTLLGTKGMGEGCGTPLPAIANAIDDAIHDASSAHTITSSHNTPEFIWRILNSKPYG
ncbi:MAG TPA: xanthine dehydrogenase family protein molybdopterin-binding subunit [Nitrososphaerales archaeon]|nr:xanthine dehydrogenase family protein molybdopterin-binding subunit [Nitrososphaerales archaeon]